MDEQGMAPTLLVAMPQLIDPNFSRAVVLLCQHSDDGALGFIVNRPIDVDLSEILEFEDAVPGSIDLTAWQGGPVSPGRGWLICRGSESGGDVLEVCEGIYMSSSQAHLREVVTGGPETCQIERSRLLLGYAGWGPGQLDQEMLASGWLTVPVTPDLVFDTPAEALWDTAIRTLGVEPGAISPGPGIH